MSERVDGRYELQRACVALAEAAGATGDEAAREAIKVGRVFLAKRPHAGAPRFKGDRG
jgi:hypothetical protein